MTWKSLLIVIITSTVVSSATNLIRCECGIKNSDVKHFQGRKEFAGNHAWPWMISIVNVTINEEPVAYCGASLINDRYIMTAAHCLPDMNDTGIDNFRIFLGTNYIENGSDFLNLGIMDILTHPKFDFDSADFDVALIKLSSVVTFSQQKWIRPICLQQIGSPFDDRIAFITGWGSYNLTEPTEDALKEADVKVVPNAICEKDYSKVDIPVTENMLCAALPNQDPCKGDSGGPLVIRDSIRNKYNQIGIISHGEGCSVPNYPAIFSRVEKFIPWIKENTQDAFYCRGTFD